MTFVPRNQNIHCDCLQPGCPYCDRDGSRQRAHDEQMKEILAHHQKEEKPPVENFELPEGWLDWNTLTLDQMVEHLRKKFMFDSSGDAKCIYHLIEFYDKHKPTQ